MSTRKVTANTGVSAQGIVRVVVVDDHPILRRGLVDVINEAPDLTVCAAAGTTAAALTAINEQRPDVAIVDLTLGDEDGLELVALVAKQHPAVRMLVLSSHDERLYADRALKAGALGYMMKDQGASSLLAAIRRVATGKPWVSDEAAERIFTLLGSRATHSRAPIDTLSDRERHVLTLVGRGMATREIATQLGLSVKTVESHYAHIKDKLGLRNARELTRVAIHWSESERR